MCAIHTPWYAMPLVAGMVRVSCPKGSGFVVYYVYLAYHRRIDRRHRAGGVTVEYWHPTYTKCLPYSLITVLAHTQSGSCCTGTLHKVPAVLCDNCSLASEALAGASCYSWRCSMKLWDGEGAKQRSPHACLNM